MNQLAYTMMIGKLGEQFVLKSKKAFDLIESVSYVQVDHTEYYSRRKARDKDARAYFRA